MTIDKNKLAFIHIVKKELGLQDEEYRNILKQVSGVGTARDLDEAGFRKLVNYFVRSGWYRINKYGFTIRQKLYIKQLAGSLGWDEKHLENFTAKYYHKNDINKLTRKEAGHLIESLKNVRKHMRYKLQKA